MVILIYLNFVHQLYLLINYNKCLHSNYAFKPTYNLNIFLVVTSKNELKLVCHERDSDSKHLLITTEYILKYKP